MKKTLSYLTFAFFIVSISALILGNANGRADQEGKGNTGAPGDDSQTCISCHNGGPIAVNINLTMTDTLDSALTTYTAGVEYKIKVEVTGTAGTVVGYGYQLVSLYDQDDTGYDGFKSPASNVKLVNANNRQYAEHDGVSNSNIFEVRWVAPETAKGPITFYTCGNGVDSNNHTSGDGAAKTSLTVHEFEAASVGDLERVHYAVYPNPFTDFISINGFDGEITVFNIIGNQIEKQYISKQSTLSTEGWEEGLYFMNFTNSKGELVAVKRILKN